jgi:hypothetical protein
MRLSHLALALTATFALACSGGNGNGTENNENNDAPACPYTFPDPTATFDQADSPALLTFASFPDGETEVVGADGSSFQYIAQSIVPFIDSDGREDRSPTITYTQNTGGAALVFTPDEIAAEYDRRANNAINTLGATTSNTTIQLGGEEVNVLVATADASKTMTAFVPIDSGAFLVPVEVGVFTGRAGCDATRDATFDALKASIALNADSTFGDLAAVQEAKAAKSN